MSEVRTANHDDLLRAAAVDLFKRCVAEVRPGSDYDADIEYLSQALVAFAERWRAVPPLRIDGLEAEYGERFNDGPM